MSVTPTYPGVYVQEISSGVRTITGVATSIAAFIGGAKRGPINRAVRVLGFADFERAYGGLSSDSEMSYAVRQFFSNGGGEAWIVRVAKSPAFASLDLKKNPTDSVLAVTARDAGAAGNNLRVLVDHATSNPASTFNLTVIYSDPNDPSAAVSEKFENLSMNSFDARYVKTVVNGRSELVTVERTASLSGFTTAGKSLSGPITLLDIDATHNRFRISVNGADPVDITFNHQKNTTFPELATELSSAVAGVPVSVSADAAAKTILFTSTAGGERSSVRILPALTNDATTRMKLGTAKGGVETDGVASLRPIERPLGGSITGGAAVVAPNTLPKAGSSSFAISLDGGPKRTVTIPLPLAADVGDLASKIQTEVRKLDTSDAYRKFTATASAGILTLTSGTRGTGSRIALTAGDAFLTDTGLNAAGTTITVGADDPLTNGSEQPFDIANPFATIIASRVAREGLYALEAVDLFNILCLPGVSDPATVAEATAYCEERRAFFIIDSPQDKDKPDEMEAYAAGTSLPKSNYAAVYYPWIRVGDPLNDGALRSVAPSGTIAGVYARTDANRGVWKAPAGTDASLAGVQAVDYLLTDRENGILNPRGVNCNRIFPVYGAVAWGARTLRGDDAFADEWKYVPVRRIALFIEESLFRGTKWVVFEPNDEPLWSQIRLNIGAFMQNLFRQGAFQGRSPREAYLVKCDKETTTQNDINLGVVNILVGFAPLKPAEFVFIRIQQLAGQILA